MTTSARLTHQATVTKGCTLYDRPGYEGNDLRRLHANEGVKVLGPWCQGRWAEIQVRDKAGFTTNGFVKSKRLRIGTKRVDDHFGYTGFRDGTNYGSTRDGVAPMPHGPRKLKATWSCESAEDYMKTDDEKIESAVKRVIEEKRQDVEKAPEEPVAVEVLERLVEAVETKEPPLHEPGRSRLAFFDRFCSWREQYSTPNENVTKVSEARYQFASTLVRWTAGAFIASQSIPYLTGIFKNFAG
jgi:hypothetical protein